MSFSPNDSLLRCFQHPTTVESLITQVNIILFVIRSNYWRINNVSPYFYIVIRSNDVRRRHVDVLVPDFETGRQT